MHTRSTLSECPASVARSSKNYHTYATRAHVQCAEKMIRIAQCVQVHARARTRMMCNVKVVLARQLREIDARASLYIYTTLGFCASTHLAVMLLVYHAAMRMDIEILLRFTHCTWSRNQCARAWTCSRERHWNTRFCMRVGILAAEWKARPRYNILLGLISTTRACLPVY